FLTKLRDLSLEPLAVRAVRLGSAGVHAPKLDPLKQGRNSARAVNKYRTLRDHGDGESWLDDDAAEQLPGFQNLETVDVTSGTVSSEGLRHFGRCQELKYLRLESGRHYSSVDREISAEQAELLCEAPKLQHLHLATYNCTDAACEALAKVGRLQSLTIGAGQLSNDGVSALAGIAALSELTFHIVNERPEEQLSRDDGVERLTTLDLEDATQLQYLEIRGGALRGPCFAPLRANARLSEIVLDGVGLDLEACRSLITLSQLRRLTLYRWRDDEISVDDVADFFAGIAAMPNLEELTLPRASLDVQLSEILAASRSLEVVYVRKTGRRGSGREGGGEIFVEMQY
ncbi:hypothetical protein, partial [Botrimarina sp.]|uniref:hypothetical protein n=1 Tax=Botrimarina sp. TaxID=2795802 RepID=UPI0032ED8285